MKNKIYMVWGKPKGLNKFCKLHSSSLREAKSWRQKNEKYYDDMRIYRWFGASDPRSYNPNISE